MSRITLPYIDEPANKLRCYYRPALLILAGIVLFASFWFLTRYPQLLEKSRHAGEALPSMAFSSERVHAADGSGIVWKILVAAINWLDAMKIGMSFGVLLGALLHTTLRYYPLKIGSNIYLNSIKGALVGVPAAICANCSVPTACGITRGKGRIEVALGFLFSAPNFNPVVIIITLAALPLTMAIVKYALLIILIAGFVPMVISLIERKEGQLGAGRLVDDSACEIPALPQPCTKPLVSVAIELGHEFAANVWMLAKPTIVMMVLASVAAAVVLTLLPVQDFLTTVTVAKLFFITVMAVFMPVPIALDVLFAAQLYRAGVSPAYVMVFLMTLGTYSIIPAVYLWREVSKQLAVILFATFVGLGVITGLIFWIA